VHIKLKKVVVTGGFLSLAAVAAVSAAPAAAPAPYRSSTVISVAEPAPSPAVLSEERTTVQARCIILKSDDGAAATATSVVVILSSAATPAPGLLQA
jgi:hypothetical protein